MDENRTQLRPVLLTIGLVWGHSKYFHTLENMVLLFELWHNSLIENVILTIEPESCFGDVDEAYKRIIMNIDHVAYYK